MPPRYRTEKTRKQAETIYKLRQQGRPYKDIASRTGLTYQNTAQLYRRECLFRKQAFYYPFIEYITTRTEKAIRRSLGDDFLDAPEGLNDPEALRTLFYWPGVSDGVLKDLSEGLVEAGYESFDPEQIKERVFNGKKAPTFKPLMEN
ncbi:MAG: hypothetical protein ACOC90_04700 [Bacteroidota bacterium]